MTAPTEPRSNCGNDAQQIKTETVRNIDEAKTEVGN